MLLIWLLVATMAIYSSPHNHNSTCTYDPNSSIYVCLGCRPGQCVATGATVLMWVPLCAYLRRCQKRSSSSRGTCWRCLSEKPAPLNPLAVQALGHHHWTVEGRAAQALSQHLWQEGWSSTSKCAHSLGRLIICNGNHLHIKSEIEILGEIELD